MILNSKSVLRAATLLLMFVLFTPEQSFSQPNKVSNVYYFNKYIKFNENRISAFENIQKLRNKLKDTTLLEQYSKDTLWLIKNREAVYLNFLCYLYQSKLTGGNVCLLKLAFDNLNQFYRLKNLTGFPKPDQYETEIEDAKNYQKGLCIKVYIKNKSDVKLMPDSACGCREIILQLKKEFDEQLYASEKSAKEAIKNKILLQQKQIQDSIKRLNDQIRYEPIYWANGNLRADTNFTIKSSNIDSLNIVLVNEMLRTSQEVFSYFVNNCASENIEIMLDALMLQKNSPIYWFVKLRKINGVITLTDDIPLNTIGNRMLLKLISELNVAGFGRFVNDNELFVLPFKVYRNNTHTDNRTVEYRIEDGYVHIILPVVITDPKKLLPNISPEEYKNWELERERTRE